MQILGHNKQIAIVENRIFGNKPLNTWLFAGNKGIGKASAAKYLAKKILNTTDFPHPEFFILDSNSVQTKNIPIEKVREIGNFLKLTSTNSGKKVIIIDDIELLSINSLNALLKTLEEPKENVFIFLICHKEHNCLPTIKSRCSIVRFNDLKFEEALKIVNLNKPNIPLEYITITNNSPGLTLQFIENKTFDFYEKFLNLLLEGKTFNIRSLPNINIHELEFLVLRICGLITKKQCNLEINATELESKFLKIATHKYNANKSLFNWQEINNLLKDVERINLDFYQSLYLIGNLLLG